MDAAPTIRSKRRAHTLIELVAAMTSATALMAGMGGTIYIASRALDDGGSNAVQKVKDARILGKLTRDVKFALSFSERTDKAITFTVPDRDGDNLSETIRYAWSGTSGDPLTYEYNGSSPEVIAEDVQTFSLSTLTRFMAAPPLAGFGGENLLFVVTSAGIPTSQESLRQALFESWGYSVTLIDVHALQSEFDAAAALNDVAYISEEINSGDLGTKLRGASLGVVNEEPALADEFGISSSSSAGANTDIDIVDNTHYITSEFGTGPLTIFDWATADTGVAGTLAPGLQVLGQYGTRQSLVVLEQGGALYDSGTAAGRRVQLPWGGTAFDVNSLTFDGQTLLQRAIEWAAGAAGDGEPDTSLIAHWKLDETTGLIAADSSANGNNGTLTGGLSFDTDSVSPGQNGDALQFDGSLDYISVPNHATLQPTGALTITAWIKGDSWGAGSNVNIILRKGEANPNNYQLSITDGRVALNLDNGDGSGFSGDTVLATGQWYHVAATWDGSEVLIYVNGVLNNAPSDPRSGSIGTDERAVYVGGRAGTDLFDGTLDDVRLYNRALSAEEIVQVKNGEM